MWQGCSCYFQALACKVECHGGDHYRPGTVQKCEILTMTYLPVFNMNSVDVEPGTAASNEVNNSHMLTCHLKNTNAASVPQSKSPIWTHAILGILQRGEYVLA